MTISTPTFQRLQSGVVRADDLRVREPVNAMMAWLSGGLVTQLNSQFDAVSTSISAALVAFRGTANTWGAVQTISMSATGELLVLISSDGGAGQGPGIHLNRTSGSPAANDPIGYVRFNGRDSGGNDTVYSEMRAVITDPSNASEDVTLQINNVVAGAFSTVMQIGAGLMVGSAADMGFGTLNIDNALYRDGTQVVDARVTGYGDPFGALSRATFSVTTVTTAQLAQFVKAIYTDLKAHGLIGN